MKKPRRTKGESPKERDITRAASAARETIFVEEKRRKNENVLRKSGENPPSYLGRYQNRAKDADTLRECGHGTSQPRPSSANAEDQFGSRQLDASAERRFDALSRAQLGMHADVEAPPPHVQERRKEIARGQNTRQEPHPVLHRDFYGRLTKGKLKELDTGMILISNATDHPLRARLQTVLGPKETREPLWRRMRELGVDGDTFSGFMDVRSFQVELEVRRRCFIDAMKRKS